MLSDVPPVFPPGCEHLDPNRLLDGYTDRGAYAEWTASIEQSPNDPSKYHLIKLKNGLECMLVQNPTAETCSASMAVRVGHLQDPHDLPGLAHFLEHLLFMGSAKYPGENDYSDYLNEHNGWSNAFTSTHQTVYFFETAQSGFSGALDRFAQFFVSPLFNENCVEREIKAVDSEHNKNLQKDGWRVHQLDKSLAKKDHVYHKFGTGNLDTLWNKPRARGVDVRAELIKFYEAHYSANLMKLVLVSSQPIETSLTQALEFFNSIPNYSTLPTIFSGDPYDASVFMTKVGIKTLTDCNSVSIQFPFFDFGRDVGSRSAKIVSYLLSNGGPSSLYTFLKNKGLISSLEAYPSIAAPGIYFFEIDCDLTKEGLDQHQLVVTSIFEYIKLLASQPFPDWAFQEVRRLLDISYRFQESKSPSDISVSLSKVLHERHPRNLVLTAHYKVNDEDCDKTKEVLNHLIKQKARIRITSQKELPGLVYDQTEKWYGTEYAVQPLDTAWFMYLPSTDEKMSLPEPNSFIPTNLELLGPRNAETPFPRPLCIKQTSGQRIWWKQDDRWKVPRAAFWLKMANPMLDLSSKNRILSSAYIYLVSDALEQHTYDASVAGLAFQLSLGRESMELRLRGYTDKMMVLLKVILYAMRNFKIDEKRFAAMKEEKLKNLENEAHLEPLRQANIEFNWITSVDSSNYDRRKAIWSDLSLEDVHKFCHELLSNFYIEALVHGNIDKLRAFEMVNMAEEIFGFSRLPRDVLEAHKTRVVPEESNYIVRFSTSSKEEVNNGIEYYLNVGHPDDQGRLVRLYLLHSLIGEPCFNVLRTKEQLGYIVGAGLRSGPSHIGLRFVIQSARSPLYLETRINNFLSEFFETLSNLEPEKFENAKAGLIKDLQEDYKNQREESETYWAHINNGLYDFFRSDRLVSLIKPLCLNDLVTFFKKYIDPASTTRAKLSIHVYSKRIGLHDIDKLVEVLAIHDVETEIVKTAVKRKILVKDLRDVVEKHLAATNKELHDCCQKEILAEVDRLQEYPNVAADLPGALVISSKELRNNLAIGKERTPIGEFYDGVARL